MVQHHGVPAEEPALHVLSLREHFRCRVQHRLQVMCLFSATLLFPIRFGIRQASCSGGSVASQWHYAHAHARSSFKTSNAALRRTWQHLMRVGMLGGLMVNRRTVNPAVVRASVYSGSRPESIPPAEQESVLNSLLT